MQITKSVALSAVVDWSETMTINRKTGKVRMDFKDNTGEWTLGVEADMSDWLNAAANPGRLTAMQAMLKESMSRIAEAHYGADGVTINIAAADISVSEIPLLETQE